MKPLLTLVAVLVAAVPAVGREFSVTPAAAEPGVDVHAFATDPRKLNGGNAALLYLQAIGEAPARIDGHAYTEAWNEAVEALDAPASEFEISDVLRLALSEWGNALIVAEPAVRRTTCDWGSPLDEQGIRTLLPYLNGVRDLGRAMRIDLRMKLAAGDRDGAEAMARRLWTLAGHVATAERAVLIDGLVGLGVAGDAAEATLDLAVVPDAPNYYWALTRLPRPLAEPADYWAGEGAFMPTSIAQTLVDGDGVSAQEWFALLRLYESSDEVPDNPLEEIAYGIAARARLVELGYDEATIEARGLYTLWAEWNLRDYERQFDARMAVALLPYPEAVEAEATLPEPADPCDRPRRAGVFHPTTLSDLAVFSFLRMRLTIDLQHREVEALRILEAVRDHAARHDGQPPATLADLRLPIDNDPVTGEPFAYQTIGNTFTLVAPDLDRISDGALNWTVTLRDFPQ